MSHIRINATIRDTVVKGLLNHRFSVAEGLLEERREQLKQRLQNLKEIAYKAVYGTQAEKMLAVPKGWMEERDSVRVEIEGRTRIEVYFAKNMPIPQEDLNYSKAAAIFKADCEYLVEFDSIQEADMALRDDQRELDKEISQLKNRALAIINSVTTVKRLLEVWPEVAEFLPEENAGPVGGVPAVLIEDLNNAFGLKKAE